MGGRDTVALAERFARQDSSPAGGGSARPAVPLAEQVKISMRGGTGEPGRRRAAQERGQQERQDRAVGLGDIQRPLRHARRRRSRPGRLRGRLQHEGLAQRGPRVTGAEPSRTGSRARAAARGSPWPAAAGQARASPRFALLSSSSAILCSARRPRPSDQGLQERRTDLVASGGARRAARPAPQRPRRRPGRLPRGRSRARSAPGHSGARAPRRARPPLCRPARRAGSTALLRQPSRHSSAAPSIR